MGKVVIDISMSVDGFVTGPDAGPARGLGIGGEALHTWAFSSDEADRAVLDRAAAASGAVVMGRRTFDVVDGPDGWSDQVGYGAERDQSTAPPCYVVTSRRPEVVRLADRFTFVHTGVADAIDRAREVAADKDVVVMGGADVCQQVLALRLADELSLHLAPVLLGAGAMLFAGVPLELEQVAAVPTSTATHLTYRLVR